MKIRRRRYPSGNITWVLDCGLINGKRDRPHFDTKEEAETEMARRKGELKRAGESAFALSDEERIRCKAALEKLAAAGMTLEQAVDFALKHARPLKGQVRLEALRDGFLQAREEDPACGDKYLGRLKVAVKSFVLHAGPQTWAHEVTRPEVEKWLWGNGWEHETQTGYLSSVRTMFAWGIEPAGHLSLNPCDGVMCKDKPGALPHADRDDEIEFLALAAVERLLRRAAEVYDAQPRRDARGRTAPIDLAREDFRDCLAFVVIGLFCGLRPDRELGKMTWQHVKQDAGVVVVTSGRAKTRQRRTVDLPLNARAWLAECPFKEGAILPRNFRRKWRRLRESAGLLQDWPHDGVRHTYCTMHYALHRDEKLLQVLMGHASAAMIHQHYRGLATPREGAAFFNLWPYAWGASCDLPPAG